jgi:hypothetical protein
MEFIRARRSGLTTTRTAAMMRPWRKASIWGGSALAGLVPTTALATGRSVRPGTPGCRQAAHSVDQFHLFEILEQEITALRKSKRKGFVKVARAGGRQPPQDLTKADDIMEWLDSRGIIEEQYTVLKDMTESARHLEVDMKRGGNIDD